MKILICVGTRPEWLKLKPIINLLDDNEYELLFTGQHIDLLSEIYFHYKIDILGNGNRLSGIVSSCLLSMPKLDYDYVLVQGDTASAFGCALSSFHSKIKIIHLEAGLRTYDNDNPYPEESYRQMISRIADINFCPTELSYNNLISENVFGKSYIVGNTVLDNLVNHRKNTIYGNKVLITLHRRENHDIMDLWFKNINIVAENHPNLKFILPIHPNPNVLKHKHILSDNIEVIEPLVHHELIKLLVNCRFVITDSGGIQEEATFLNKISIVCRKTTERPEGINTGHLHLCDNPDKLSYYVDNIADNNFVITNECPYGDGKSSEKIIKILRNGNSNS
jgi:UDP-N-acetylglucosamine 2-epimerase (non-hydrolysing)